MQIYNHDSPEAIAFKNNYIELENWLDHLNYIEKEITNLVSLGKAELTVNSESHPILLKFLKEKDANNLKRIEFQKYQDGLPRAVECEDVECDMFFISEHEKFRNSYMKHLKNYRKVKEEYFNVLLK
jgi:hypothetical protein